MTETRVIEPLLAETEAGGGAESGVGTGAGPAGGAAHSIERGAVDRPARKPRWWLRLLAALAIVGVLAGVAELVLRAVIPNIIATSVRENIGLREDHPVDVVLGGSALLPALVGRVGPVEVFLPGVEVIEGLSTDLYASAQSMPFDPTKGDIEGASASATVASSSLDSLVALVTNGMIDTGKVGDDEITVGRTLQVFGFEIQLEVSLALSVSDGDLLVKPTALNAAGFDLSTDELRPLLGESAAVMLDEHVVCVRDRMPEGIELTDIELRSRMIGGTATVRVDLAPDILSNPARQQLGSC